VDETEYRAIARRAAELLGDAERPAEVAAWLPPWVATAACGLVVERHREGLELYPVRDGAVLDEAASRCAPAGLEAAVTALSWTAAAPALDDRPWLCAWLHTPRRTGVLLPVPDPEPRGGRAARVARALAAPPPRSAPPSTA
jgi:hypothetical protein